MKITPSTAILLAAALSTNTLVQGRALPFAGGLEVLRDSAVALARRDIGPDVSAVTDIFRRSAAPVPPPGGRNTNPNRDRGRDRPGKPTGGRPRPRPNKDGDGSGGDGDNGAPLCRRMPGGCGETPEGYERPSYKIKDGENEIDFFALGKLTRAGEVKQGVKAQTYPKDTIESNYYSTKPKQVKPEEAAVVEGGSPASTKSDHQLNLKVPFADKIFGGKLSDTKPWSRVRTHTREKGANDDADYADAGAAIDAFYSPESGALIAEETFAAKDSNKGNNRVPLSTVQIQKYKDLAGEDAGPPQYVVRRSVSEKVTAQINVCSPLFRAFPSFSFLFLSIPPLSPNAPCTPYPIL